MRLVLTRTDYSRTPEGGEIYEGAVNADKIINVHVEERTTLTTFFRGSFKTSKLPEPMYALVAEMENGKTYDILSDVAGYADPGKFDFGGELIARIMCERLIKALADLPDGSVIAPEALPVSEGYTLHHTAATHYLFSLNELDTADFSKGYWMPRAECFTAEEMASEINETTYAVSDEEYHITDKFSLSRPKEAISDAI